MDFIEFIGNIGTLQAFLFIIGILLLIAEMFMPGFGFAGGTGIILIVIAILLTASTPLQALLMILALLVLVGIVFAVVLRSASKGKLSKKLLLHAATRNESGYTAADDTSGLVGKSGVALSPLRPAGSGLFGGQRLDVVSVGDYIEKDTVIRIIEAYGSRIVVAPQGAVPAAEESEDRT